MSRNFEISHFSTLISQSFQQNQYINVVIADYIL